MKTAYNFGTFPLTNFFTSNAGNVTQNWYYADKKIYLSSNGVDVILVAQSNRISDSGNAALIFRVNPISGEFACYSVGADPLKTGIFGAAGTSFFAAKNPNDMVYLAWALSANIDEVAIPFGYTNSPSFYPIGSSVFSLPAVHPLNSSANLLQSFIDLERNLHSGLYAQVFSIENHYYSLVLPLPGGEAIASVDLGSYPSGINPYNQSTISGVSCTGSDPGFVGGCSGTQQNTIVGGQYSHIIQGGPLFVYSPRIWTDGSRVDFDPAFPPNCFSFKDSDYQKIGESWAALPSNAIARTANFLGLNTLARTPMACGTYPYASLFDVFGNIYFTSLSGYTGVAQTVTLGNDVYVASGTYTPPHAGFYLFKMAAGAALPVFNFASLDQNAPKQHNLVNMVRPISIKGDFKA